MFQRSQLNLIVHILSLPKRFPHILRVYRLNRTSPRIKWLLQQVARKVRHWGVGDGVGWRFSFDRFYYLLQVISWLHFTDENVRYPSLGKRRLYLLATNVYVVELEREVFQVLVADLHARLTALSALVFLGYFRLEYFIVHFLQEALLGAELSNRLMNNVALSEMMLSFSFGILGAHTYLLRYLVCATSYHFISLFFP